MIQTLANEERTWRSSLSCTINSFTSASSDRNERASHTDLKCGNIVHKVYRGIYKEIQRI